MEKKVVQFKLSDDAVRMIRDYAYFKELSDMNEALEDMIRAQYYLTTQVKNGGKVIVEKRDGVLRQVDLRAQLVNSSEK